MSRLSTEQNKKQYPGLTIGLSVIILTIAVGMMTWGSCTAPKNPIEKENDGYNTADSIVNAIGDAREYDHLLELTDSFERTGDLTEVRAIFYSTIAYNLMGKHRTALSQYYRLAHITAKDLQCQADLECYIYTCKDYMRLLCDMRRYDRALRVVQNADRKLRQVGYETFTDHHDIAQMIGECQLYLDQTDAAMKSFDKSLQAINQRLATYHDPLDLRECQKTMNAIAKELIRTGRYNEAKPWLLRQDSLFIEAENHPKSDSVFIDEMKAEINYSKALLANAQGHTDEAERAFAKYRSTKTAQQLGSIIASNEYLMLTHRYDEAANNYTRLEEYLKTSGYKADIENIGRYILPKFRANLLAGNRDSALAVAALVAQYFDTALVRQKISDADLLATVYDTEGKERQIAEQRAELSQQRLFTVGIVLVIMVIFFHIHAIQRRKAYKKLNEKNQQLMEANMRAEESSRMKTKFIQQIPHEVRTPLNVLSGFTQVLANPNIEIDNNELQSISKKIVDNSERITHLVDKMLDLSLVNCDADIECNDKVTAEEVAQIAIKQSEIRQAAHLEFELQVDNDAKQLTITTNQKAAVKSLMLLLDNAIKFTHPLAFKEHKDADHKEHVVLKISKQGKMVVFSVEDTGIGVPAEQAENIFIEFVQLDEYSDGTGIGLSIARALARHLKGDITLDTTYTPGARFVMTLPL